MLLKCLSVPVAAGQSVFRQAERRDNRAVRTADRRASAQQLGRNVKAGGSQLCPPHPHSSSLFCTSAEEHAQTSNEGFQSDRQKD